MRAILLTALLVLRGPAGAQLQTGAVSGRVLSSDGTAAANIRVAAMPAAAVAVTAKTLESIGQTDSDGRYRLEGITPGRYYIFAGLIDYPNYYPGTASLERATVVVIEAKESVADIDFALVRPLTMTIAGKLKASGAVDLSKERVTLSSSDPNLARGGRFAQVDAQGGFAFPGLLPGRYELNAGRGSTAITVNLDDRSLMDVELLRVDCDAGTPVRGQLVGVPSAPVTRIGLAGALLRCIQETAVQADGSFSFIGVPDDEYAVQLKPAPLGWTSTKLAVVDRSVTGNQITLPATVLVKGRITVEDGSPVPRLTRGPIPVVAMGRVTVTTPVDDDGAFAFRLLKGQYRITLDGVPANYTIRSVQYGADDLNRTPLAVDETPSNEIHVTLGILNRAKLGVRVTGRIIPAREGALTRPEGVLLLSASGSGNTPNLTTAVDDTGAFEFYGVASGQYHLQTLPDSPVMLRDIRIGRLDVTDVELEMPVLFKLKGAIEWGDALDPTRIPDVPEVSIQFSRRVPGGDGAASSVLGWATLAKGGTFQVYLPQGDYRFSVAGLPTSARLESATHGAQDLIQNEFHVDANLNDENMRVKLRRR